MKLPYARTRSTLVVIAGYAGRDARPHEIARFAGLCDACEFARKLAGAGHTLYGTPLTVSLYDDDRRDFVDYTKSGFRI